MNEHVETLAQIKSTIIDLSIKFGPKVLVAFAIMAVQNLGVELLPLIAGIGLAGAGVALAMQGVLGNLVAGLTIIFTRPFRVGEYISMLGVEGRVEAISLLNSVLS